MMKNRIQRYYIYTLAALFIAAGVLNAADMRKMSRIRLYFINRQSGHLATQWTYIPRVGSLNEKTMWILRELISGPVDSRYERTLSPDIDVREVIIQDRTAYVSLGWGFVDSLSRDPAVVVQSIVSSILQNVRSLNDVRILIEGVEPVNTLCGVSLRSVSLRRFFRKKTIKEI